MASTRKQTEPNKPRRAPATTPEAQEQELIGLAVDLVKKKLISGEATSQEITHLLKLGSTREKLEQERLMREVDLLEKRAQSMESAKRVEELYEEAIRVMRKYGGEEPLGMPE